MYSKINYGNAKLWDAKLNSMNWLKDENLEKKFGADSESNRQKRHC